MPADTPTKEREPAPLSRSRKRHPYVSANFAVTWDGRISTRANTPSDFSSPADKRRLLELRARADAILVTARTAKADGMTMGLPDVALRSARRARGRSEFPLRVLLSNSGLIEPTLPVFTETFSPIIIFSTERMPASTRQILAPLAELHLQDAEITDLTAVLATLHTRYGIRRAHCEGGGTLLRALAERNLLDELFVTMCPRIFGSTTAPTLSGAPGNFMAGSRHWQLRSTRVVDEECFLRYTAKYGK